MSDAKQFPESDWMCRDVIDSRAIDQAGQSRCEFCNTRIRWIHVLEHDDYHRGVEAGCCCAARLCFDYDAEAAEREVKNRVSRMTRFANMRQWKRSRENAANVWRVVRLDDGSKVRVTIFLRSAAYGIYIAGMKGAMSTVRFCHHERYGSQAEAIAVAFGLVDGLKDDSTD